MFKAKIFVDFNTSKVLDDDKIASAQKHLVTTVKEKTEPYVPWLTGRLKSTVKENRKSIVYAPYNGGHKSYAAINYYTNRGMGKQGTSMGGKRGKKWVDRMWSDHKDEIVKEVADMIGGKPG